MQKKIVLEGIDGCGKDTQMNKIMNYLRKQGTEFDCFWTPDKQTVLGRTIYDFLDRKFDLPSETQFLLYAADVIYDKERIAASKKKFILLNRYITSTIAYQGGQGFPLEKALNFVKLYEYPRMDLIFYIKVSPEVAVRRLINQKNILDRFESQEAYLKKVADIYDKLAEGNVLGKWIIIDGEKSSEEVFQEIKKYLV